MRTTISLDNDVLAAVQQLRQSEGMGLSEAVNTIARRGLGSGNHADFAFRSPSFDMHAKLDHTNIADVLDILDGH